MWVALFIWVPCREGPFFRGYRSILGGKFTELLIYLGREGLLKPKP